MAESYSTKILAVTAALFFFTSNMSLTFLPIYFKESGMPIPEIIVILLFTFLVIGLLPRLLVEITRHFERIISLGIILTMLFYIALIYVKNPVLLGLAYGLSIATFWPSFNLLQFRLTEAKERAFLISLLSVAIPGVTGIISPTVGGFIIERFGFTVLFVASIVLFLASFIFSLLIRFKPEAQSFSLPKNRLFIIFMATFVLWGFSESYWLAYPLYVLTVSSTVLNVGLVTSASSLIIVFANVLIGKVSDIKMMRVEFAIVSSILYAIWYFALPAASNMTEIILLSLLSGFASAFALSWFAHYGDSFSREYHASILVMMEVGFMIGRILNLIPTYLFITANNYANYFAVLGFMSLLLTPLFMLSKKSRV
ncbi:MAG: MFS transporter [Candidatus Bathyarchaeia archaeon]